MTKLKILIIFVILIFIGTYFYVDFKNDRTLYLAQQEYEDRVNANTNHNFGKQDTQEYLDMITDIDGTVQDVEDAFGQNGYISPRMD